jgi:hypothetical protein
MKKLATITLILIGIAFYVNGQNDTICNAIKVNKKGKSFKERKNMNTFSKKGFYIYKDYCYSLIFKGENKVFGRIVDILDDTIFITNSLNSASALKRNIHYDTLEYSIADIKKLQLITEDIDGYTKDINMDEYNLQSVEVKCCNHISQVSDYKNPQVVYDSYPYLTNSGIAFIYEKEGKIHIVGSRR